MTTQADLEARIKSLEAALAVRTISTMTAEERAANVRAQDDAQWSTVNVNDAQALHRFLGDLVGRLDALEK